MSIIAYKFQRLKLLLEFWGAAIPEEDHEVSVIMLTDGEDAATSTIAILLLLRPPRQRWTDALQKVTTTSRGTIP